MWTKRHEISLCFSSLTNLYDQSFQPAKTRSADYTLQNFCLASLSTTSVEVRALSAEEETVRVVSSISSHPTDWSDLAWMERMERLAGTRSSKD
ncbi:uncharacterized protein LOC121588924 isoform X3 [Anopheles merus]|uniref:uncharacterized protein LOC121588924 isoform X3 n=1 Tax=Anopheles merus TaxID=30066 RepID=UPI001BE4C6CD|nr:uncharacterized protein LOC121588924 isoform X3 [Anopheles merus]